MGFSHEKYYIKAAQFMDLFCVDDVNLWINLEIFILKKDNFFTPEGLVKMMSHFARQ